MSIQQKIIAMLAALGLSASAGAAAETSAKPDYARVVPLVATSKTIVGEPIVYPPGTARITSAIVTLRPGESAGMHKHGVPTYGYILSGAVTVDYGAHGKREYGPGTAFMEAMDVWHDGTNAGSVPCRILVVFMGAEARENVIKR